MKYTETAIGKVHTTGIDGHISQEEYLKIYNFFSQIGISSGVAIKDILACLAIIRHGEDIGEKAKREEAFTNAHKVIKDGVFRICEIVDTHKQEIKVLKI